MIALRKLAAAGVAAAVALLPTAPAAIAAPPGLSINTGSGWTQGSTTPLFSIGKIVPGWSDTEGFEIRNDTTSSGVLYLAANNIVEAENGCTPDESLVDTTCGANEGELGQYLQFRLFLDPENDGTFEATPAWTGTLGDIATPIVLSSNMPAGGTWGIRVEAALPIATGNQTQSDQVGFDFALTLTGAGTSGSSGDSSGSGPSTGPGSQTTPQGPGSVEVKGIKVSRADPGLLHDITSSLPFTGGPVERLLAGAVWLLVAGTALSMLAAARRRGRAIGN